jgi:hypothetical protein
MSYDADDAENHIWWNSHDTDTCIYLEYEQSFEELSKKIQIKWPGCKMDQILFSAVRINARGCGCHAHPSDYDTLLQIEKLP